jgi:hypothetical protein
MSDQGLESVLSWLYAERDQYQTKKFTDDYDDHPPNVDNEEWWIQQFESYMQRLPIYGLDTLQGVQAALKLAATAVALCEQLADKNKLPKPGVSSGTIELWQ